jgi:ATP-dependent helicase/nuclease subunit B
VPPIKALYVYNANPVAMTPDQNRILAGLAREDLFTVVHEQVLHSAEVLVRELGGEIMRLRAGAPMPALGEGEVCETCEMRGLCRRDHWPGGTGA